MPVPRKAVKLLQGTPKQWSRPAAASDHTGFFCSDCGTRLFHQPSRNNNITNIKPGTLDDTSWLHPVSNTWITRAQPWISLSDDMMNITQQPTDKEFEEIHERFKKKA